MSVNVRGGTNAIPTVVLPRDPRRSQLGYLQCFLNPAMIDTFVTQTNQYAIDAGLLPGSL